MRLLYRSMNIQMMVLFLWIVAFAVAALAPISDPDTPWHIATGMYILQHHYVPTTDPFSWSMRGMPWVTQEWLFEVVLAWLIQQLGFVGCWLLLVVLHAATVLIVYRLCCRLTDGHRVVAVLAACLSTLVAWPFWVVRPQIVSYLMFALFMLILARVKNGEFRFLWFVPPLMLVWANSHGSASIGIVMLVLEVIISFIPTFGRFERHQLPIGVRWRVLLTAAISIGVGFINPNGIHEFTYALLSTNQLMVNSINEWHSPSFHGDYYKFGVLPYLVLMFLLLLIRRKSLPLKYVLYFGGSFAMTLIYQRFLPYLTIASAPLFALVLRDVGWPLLSPSRWMRGFCGVVMACCLVYLGSQVPRASGSMDAHFSTTAYPIAAVNYLKQHPIHGKLFNAYDFGGYLIYRGIPTFVDGRTDIYLHNGVFEDYMSLQDLNQNAPALLEKYQFNYALLPPWYAVTVYLAQNPNWHVVYQDNVAEILERNPS